MQTKVRDPITAFTALVVACAGVAGIFDGWASATKPIDLPHPAAFWVFAACCIVTELRPLEWMHDESGSQVTGSWTFMMALAMISPPLVATLVVALASVIGDLRSHKPRIRTVFNAAQLFLSVSVGALLLQTVDHGDGLDRRGISLDWFAVALAACALVYVSNAVLTHRAIAFHMRLPFWPLLRADALDNLSTDGMMLLLSPVFVIVAQRSLWLVPPLLLVVWRVFRSAQLAFLRAHEASHDALTGLPNRRLFATRLDQLIGVAQQRRQHLGVVLIDLDEFKLINDGLGHGVGDLVLAAIARRLATTCRPSDLLARLGGDEFAVVVPAITSVDEAADVGRRLIEALSEPLMINGFPIAVRASAGVSMSREHDDSAEVLLRRADEAMYSAKKQHDGLHVHGRDGEDASVGRISLLADLTRALEGEQLFLEYQPQVELTSGDVRGVEVLVRWEHPTIGVVQPLTFMPLAEQTELIGPITEWILDTALGQCAAWREDGYDLRVCVNVSARNIQDIRFVRKVERALQRAGVDPSRLLVEVTENAVGLDQSTVCTVLRELRALGVGISIDDFGTGYSAISQLLDCQVDQLKLERRFVTDMATNATNALIARFLLQLGTSLGLETVAEGVEDPLVADMLCDVGCVLGQGYLYARPMSPEDLGRWMAARNPWHLDALTPSEAAGSVERAPDR